MTQKSEPRVHTKRTYYDYQDQQIHGEYQYIQTPTNRYYKHGYLKKFNLIITQRRRTNHLNISTTGKQAYSNAGVLRE